MRHKYIRQILLYSSYSKKHFQEISAMEIPTELALTVNPTLQDPLSKSIVYTFTMNQTDKYMLTFDHDTINQEYLTVLFPYSKDTFWIQIRAAYFTESNNDYNLCYMLQITYDNGQVYYVTPELNLHKSTWQPLKFPVPSIKAEVADAKLLIKAPNGFFTNHKNTFRLFFLGFEGLYPKSPKYTYVTSRNNNPNPWDTTFVFDYTNPNTDSVYTINYADLDNSHCQLRSID